MTDEQAKELMKTVSKEFWKGVIKQSEFMKDKILECVTNVKEKIKLDGATEYGFNLAVDCFEAAMNRYIEELKKGAQNDNKE